MRTGPLLLVALCSIILLPPASKTKDFEYSLQLWSLIPSLTPTSSLLLNCEYSLRTCDTKSSALYLEEHGITILNSDRIFNYVLYL